MPRQRLRARSRLCVRSRTAWVARPTQKRPLLAREAALWDLQATRYGCSPLAPG